MISDLSTQLRALPGISQLLPQAQQLVASEGHDRTVKALRQALDEARTAIRAGLPAPSSSELLSVAANHLLASQLTLHAPTVINATGVIIHTNLGRAPLSLNAQRAMLAAMNDYSPLEFDLESGERGKRGDLVQKLLCEITGAEAALVVNNCALATVLMLSTLAKGKGVVIARGQLVEIGGGFRVPDIMQQSGAHLVEVGTTNKVRRSDYETPITSPATGTPSIGAILRVHPSNFKMIGFTQDVGVDELVAAAKCGNNIYVLDDLGSGALIDTSQFGLSREPMVQDSVRAGVAVTAFSGDKLLGGPQAGIMLGSRDAIERCRKNPMARAFRADKLTLAGLGATLMAYVRGTASSEIPVIRMMAMPLAEIETRAKQCLNAITPWCQANDIEATLIHGESTIGGGSMPGETLPTCLIALHCDKPSTLMAQLRSRATPIIARLRAGQVLIDLRTVLDDARLVESLIQNQ